MPVIEVSDLSVRYGPVTAVEGVSFEVDAGETVALLGPNGAGKTSTLEVIHGYRPPDRGSVQVLGRDPYTNRSELAARWGIMPQDGGLPMGLTVRECISLFAKLSHRTHTTDITDDLLLACGLVNISERPWRKLSGGEQQRLSLAVALAGGSTESTELLILDEPTAAVDAEGRQQILRLLGDRGADGAAVLITTHRFDDIEQLADRVIIMHKGRVVANGTMADLTQGVDLVTFATTPGLLVAELASVVGYPVVEASSGVYEVAAPASPHIVQAITSWLGAKDLVATEMRTGSETLESVYLRLTNSNTNSDTNSDNSDTNGGTANG